MKICFFCHTNLDPHDIDESFLCKATLIEEKNSFLFWSLGGPKINESEDGKREVSNPWFCMVDNRKKREKKMLDMCD